MVGRNYDHCEVNTGEKYKNIKLYVWVIATLKPNHLPSPNVMKFPSPISQCQVNSRSHLQRFYHLVAVGVDVAVVVAPPISYGAVIVGDVQNQSSNHTQIWLRTPLLTTPNTTASPTSTPILLLADGSGTTKQPSNQTTKQLTSHMPAAERFMYRAVELPVPGRLLAVLGLREEAVVGRTILRTRRRGTDGPRTPLSPLFMRCLRRSCREGEGMYVCRSLGVTKGARVLRLLEQSE